MIHNAGMMSALLAMAMMEPGKEKGKPMPSKEYLEQLTVEASERHKANMLKKGLKEFYIDGHTVFARDLKNAKRKANNLNKKL